MKLNFFLSLGVLLIYSCQPADTITYEDEYIDFSVPERVVSISALIGDHSQRSEAVHYNDSALFVSGYVISSDRGGNFYKELLIQDLPANPNAGTSGNDKKNLHLTRQAERALKTTFLEAKLFQSSSIKMLLLSLFHAANQPQSHPYQS